MNPRCEDKLQRIAEQIRNQEYQIDPVAVADGLLRRVRWDDVPEIEALMPPVRQRQRILRLRNFLRTRRLVSLTVRTRPQLSS
jgi:hypothetical protein